MVTQLGVLGTSEGNGHPYSFSAIVNGYDSDLMRRAGWSTIAGYLDARDPTDLGVGDAQVTHAWTPDPVEARSLAEAARIPNVVSSPSDLIGEVDGVLLARDDWQTHWEMAAPFLRAHIPLFVDKPLSLDLDQLNHFVPYLHAGLLMSCSGYRFAPELDDVAARGFGTDIPLHFQGVVPQEWDRYAVHVLDPILRMHDAAPERVTASTSSSHDTVLIDLEDGATASVHCLGERSPGFFLGWVAGENYCTLHLADRFTGFRRLLAHFVSMVNVKVAPIAPSETVAVMSVLAAGRQSLDEGYPVRVRSAPV